MENFNLETELKKIEDDASGLRAQVAERENNDSWIANRTRVNYSPQAVYDCVQIIQGQLEKLEMMLYPKPNA